MMEKRKRYRIADAEIEIAFTENYTEIICRDYEVKADGKPDFVIEVTDEEVEREKKKSEPGASKGIIESLAIYRKLCEKILDRNCVLFHCSAVAVDGKHTCLRLQAEQENPRIQGCGDSISAAGQ